MDVRDSRARPSRFTLGRSASYPLGGGLGPIDGLEVLDKRLSSCICRDSNTGPSMRSLLRKGNTVCYEGVAQEALKLLTLGIVTALVSCCDRSRFAMHVAASVVAKQTCTLKMATGSRCVTSTVDSISLPSYTTSYCCKSQFHLVSPAFCVLTVRRLSSGLRSLPDFAGLLMTSLASYNEARTRGSL